MRDHDLAFLTDPLPALVLGGGITGLGVVRILARDRIRAFVAASQTDLVMRSRHARPVPGATGNPGPDLANWLSGLALDRAVLIPCSDHLVERVAALPPELGQRFPASVASPGVLRSALDKGRFAELLHTQGIPHPRTWPVSAQAGLSEVPDDAFAHGFLKPRDSQAFMARYGVKGFWVRSREEGGRELARVARDGLAVQFQEYVPGPATRHVFVDGFVDRSGAIRALLVRRRLRMYPPDFGNSTLMVTIPARDAEPAVQSVRRLVDAMGYRGIFSVEFKQSDVDGRYYALEMNPRPWWYVDYAARAGCDVIRLAWLDAQGKPVPDIPEGQIGRRCVFPYYDWHAVRSGTPVRTGNSMDWLREIPGADQPIWRFSDPWPACAESAALIARKLSGTKGRA